MLGQVADKDRHPVIAEADRAANRITVTTTASEDHAAPQRALVDLSKDVTIVVNATRDRKVTRDINCSRNRSRTTWTPGSCGFARHEASVKK